MSKRKKFLELVVRAPQSSAIAVQMFHIAAQDRGYSVVSAPYVTWQSTMFHPFVPDAIVRAVVQSK